jgi:tripartite-type tricarboxylate transporter receptor subunit TctC
MTLLLRVALAFALSTGLAFPQTYPDKPISLIAPYAAGSASDITFRVLAEHMSGQLGRRINVENVTGASGLIGTEKGRRAAPDGYTLIGLSDTVLIFLPLLMKAATFDPLKDFEPISIITEVEWVLVTHPSFPAKTLSELIAYVRREPGKVIYSSGGYGSPQHVAMEYMQSKAGMDMVHVPYKGQTPALLATVAGEVSVFWSSTATAAPHIKEGRLRALATAGAQRSDTLPDIPTAIEGGLPGFEFLSWTCLTAPVGMPQEHVRVLQQAVAKAVADPAVKARFTAGGMKPVGSSTEELRKRLAADNQKLTELVRSANMKRE